MIPTLDPVELIRDALRRSRILRITAIVTLISSIWLTWLVVSGRVVVLVALMLMVFDFGVWYFALVSAQSFREHRRWAKTNLAERLAELVDLLAILAIVLCQGLFLIMVMKLASNPSN